MRLTEELYLTAMGFGCLMLIAGCASDLSYKRVEGKNAERVIIAGVPFIAQEPDHCGPATLAMIFNFWGLPIKQDEIAEEIYSPKLKGTLSLEMVLYAMQKGFDAEMYNTTLADLKEKIQAGFPLIVSHKEKPEKERVHYLVVFGFDDSKEIFYVHSGTRQNMTMDYKDFLKHWSWANNLTFFIHPKRN